jgi:hypothetical protein
MLRAHNSAVIISAGLVGSSTLVVGSHGGGGPQLTEKADPKSTRRAFPSAPSWLTSPVGNEVEEGLMSVGRGTRLA